MAVSGNTKKELIEEISALKSRLKQLEHSEAEREKAERMCRESEFQYRTTLDSMRDAIHVVDSDLKIILINEKFVKWAKGLEIEIARPIGRIIFELFPFLPDKVRDDYRKVFDTGKALITVERTEIANREIITESRKLPVFEAGKVVKVITIIRDITESKKAEEEMKKSSVIIDSTTDAVVCTDTVGNITFWNKGAEIIYGYRKGEAIGRPVSILYKKEDLHVLEAMIAALLDGKDISSIETTCIGKNGQDIKILLSLTTIKDEEGNVCELVGITKDITERKKSQEALEQSEQKFRSLAEQSPNMIFINKYGKIVYANQKCEEITGYKREEFYSPNFDFHTLIAPQSMDLIRENFKRHLEGHDVPPYEYTIINKAGETIDAINSSKLIRYEGSNAILGIVTDITERKKAEEALEQSEVKYRSLMANIPDVVWTSDEEGKTTFISPKVKDIYGYTPEEIYSQGENLWFGRIHPDDIENVKDSYKAVFQINKQLDIEYRIRRKDGQWIWIQDRSIGSYEKDGIRYADGVFSDITEQKKAEAALAESEQRFRKFFENEPEYCYMISPQGTILEINSSALIALGYAKEELVGKPLESLYAPESCQKAHQLFEQWKQTGEIRNEEMVVITQNGDRRTVLLSSTQVLSEDGKLLHSVSIQRDITEWKKTQEALKESLQASDDIVKTIPSGLFIYQYKAPDSLILLDGNPEAERLTGIKISDWIGKEFNQVWPAAQESGITEAFLSPMKTGKTFETEDLQYKDNRLEGAFRVRAFRLPADKLAVAFENITERKKAEEALRQSEEKFRSMFELSPYSTVLSDIGGNIIACNQQFTKLHATKEGPESQVGKNVSVFFPEEEKPRLFSSLQKTAAAGKNLGQSEYTMLRENGTKFRAETKSTIIMDRNGEPQAFLATAHDITERKLAEVRLRQSEERFKILFESAPDAYYIHDLDGNFIDGNRAAEELVGYSKEEAVGKSFFDLGMIVGEDISKVSRTMAENRDGKTAGPLELTIHRKDGSKVFVETRSYPVEIGGQTVVLGIARDISERKRLEEAYQSLVDNSLQGLAIIQDGRIVFLNKAFSSSTGFSRGELLTASPEKLQSLVHHEDREMVWSRHRDRLEGKSVPARYEFRWIRKDGNPCWVEIHASQIEYRGRPAIQAAYIDITERMKAEEALRQSEERLKILFESAPDAIYLCDLKGNFVDANKATEQLIGLNKAELIGKSFIETGLLSSEQVLKAVAILEKISMGKPTGPDEFTFTRKDGSSVSVEIRSFPVKIGDQMLSLSVARDISTRKSTERKLIEHQTQLKSLASELSLTEERERHRLATELHDQIGQVLIFSRIKLQELHASVSSEEIAKPLEEVYKNLDRIIQDTRTLTFDLSSPILYEFGFEAAVSEWLEEQIGKRHGIKTQFEDDGRPKPLKEDIQVLLFRNVRELLINVVKHSNAKNVKVSVSRIRKQINVSIEDDGVGFNPAETTSSRGFGIFSIRERLEQLAGSIQIESKPGQGSKIVMTAPLKCDKK